MALGAGWEEANKKEEVKNPRGSGKKLTLYEDPDDAKSAKLKLQKEREVARREEEKAKNVAAMTEVTSTPALHNVRVRRES